MPKYIVDGTDLTSIANAIRTKGETSASLSFPTGFVSAVNDIDTGGGGGGGGGGFEPPAGCEIGTFTPASDEYSHTISHSLGEVPKIAYCFSVINGSWSDLPSNTISVNEFISDPETGVFDPTLASPHKRDNVVQCSGGTSLTSTSTHTTYPASMTSTQVTFATGRYYSGKFTQGTKYIYILIK